MLSQYAFRNRQGSIALFREKRVAENEIGLAVLLAQLLDFRDDVFRRASAIRSSNTMWAVSTEFRTAPARKNRESAARRINGARRSIAIPGKQMPCRKR